jgi:hypothetical protein
MPLAFESLSHGTVAFGFFNIESDMLLLERYFFFASDFCRQIQDIAKLDKNKSVDSALEIHEIDDPLKAGDLMGAIRGIRHIGFIGETYLRFPFPKNPEEFKQKPDGHETRSDFEEMIRPYAQKKEIVLKADPGKNEIVIGKYLFSVQSFHELLDYVWRGGYPRWKDEERPNYVTKMKIGINGGNHWLFKNLVFS